MNGKLQKKNKIEGNKLKKFVKLLRDPFRLNEWKTVDIFKHAEKLSESDANHIFEREDPIYQEKFKSGILFTVGRKCSANELFFQVIEGWRRR